MWCENYKCRRNLTATEPIYRCAFGYGGHGTNLTTGPLDLPAYSVIYLCSDCIKLLERIDFLRRRTWRSPKPCEHCGRPVIHDDRRQEPQIIACSSECRRAIYNANRRSAPSFCLVCGASLTGKQRDYCSPAHKQQAYRDRAKR